MQNERAAGQRAAGTRTGLGVFIDGSVDPGSNIGYGAYLVTAAPGQRLDGAEGCVKVHRFVGTSSTRLELQTLLWALTEIRSLAARFTIYTDSQNIIGLPARRTRLERRDYFTRKNRRLVNYELYQQFYGITDQLDCVFVKVRGHQPAGRKDAVDQLFNLVDRAARKALKEDSRRYDPAGRGSEPGFGR